MRITLDGVKPYDGTYELVLRDVPLNTREFGWIKRLSGYLPTTIEDGLDGGDPEFFCVLALIALYRAGRVDAREVPALFERFGDVPFESLLSIEVDEADAGDEEEPEELDPPSLESSNGSESFSGPGSATNSGTSQATRSGFGTLASGFSPSDPPTSGT